MHRGLKLPAAYGRSTILADMDFETYSEAGFYYNTSTRKWSGESKTLRGISAVGAAVYSEHPSTEVLSLAYDLKDGVGPRLWVPGLPEPLDLFEHIQNGGLIEAWNSLFEFFIWKNVCYERMGWPDLPVSQLRDAMPKARAFGLTGGLGNVCKIMDTSVKKIEDGKRLINKFSVPRNPTKNNESLRIRPGDDPNDAMNLYDYNIKDIETEAAISSRLPDLSEFELDVWKMDQRINTRGVYIDMQSVEALILVYEKIAFDLNIEIQKITGGAVQNASEVQKIIGWLSTQGVVTKSIDSENIDKILSGEISANVRRVLEIRAAVGSSSVKKLYAIRRMTSKDSRLRGIFQYYGADRTGRWAGRGPQPQNLPNSGPVINGQEWGFDQACAALDLINFHPVSEFEKFYGGQTIKAVSGCLRGLFTAAPGHDLICSDYSAIEAVVLAAIAGEEWRLEIFRTHGMIYEASASKITGVPFSEFVEFKRVNGAHHPLRKKIGKIAELASGYQGSIGAWKAFGADKHIGDDSDIMDAVKKWRAESPNIVKLWYGLEDCARNAIMFPGRRFEYRSISYICENNVLYAILPSGRRLCYHSPGLRPDVTPWGKSIQKIIYWGWNTDYKKGPTGWMELDTYGGKLVENMVQGTARDILAYAMINLENNGYPIVLHVHDEPVSEIPEGLGSIEEFENIMMRLPEWAKSWPIKASGGWRGKRYRKD